MSSKNPIDLGLTSSLDELFTEMPVHVLLQPSGDLRPSMVLCEQILTINKSDMGDYLTHLDDQAMSKVDEALAISVGLKKPDNCSALM